jgi:tRNA(Ile)-lysidine synthase
MAVRALGPAALRVVHAVAAVTDGAGTWLVACSGGADSLALAAAAAYRGRATGATVVAACVDHGLQPGSADVAATAVARLGGLGLAATVLPVVVDPRDPAGPEAAARDARYRALDAEADRVGAEVVLLGHTLDDQAETVLLGLARGSGLRSLAGMPAASGRYRRPLLGLGRQDTVQACAEWGLSTWADPHNADPRYARARVRHRVLPVLEAELGPRVAQALARTAALAHADATLLDQLAADADPGTPDLDPTQLADLPEPIRRRVLRRWLGRAGATDLSLHHVEAVEALVTSWRGQRSVDIPGLQVVRSAGRLVGLCPPPVLDPP